jgi:hypothetical protein
VPYTCELPRATHAFKNAAKTAHKKANDDTHRKVNYSTTRATSQGADTKAKRLTIDAGTD